MAVLQTPEAHMVRGDAPRTVTGDPDSVVRQLKIDPATQQVIYQAIDTTSGEVVRQVPEEAMLRLRVYASAMRHADCEKDSDRLAHA